MERQGKSRPAQTLSRAEDRIFMLDLAVIQLIASILVTLGSTLFAISIGFELTIPSTVKEAIAEIVSMRLDGIASLENELVQQSISNYILLLALVGILLIVMGVAFASTRMNRIKNQLRKDRTPSRQNQTSQVSNSYLADALEEG